jgi:hypothetical protein
LGIEFILEITNSLYLSWKALTFKYLTGFEIIWSNLMIISEHSGQRKSNSEILNC